jgi:hypothetical protein
MCLDSDEDMIELIGLFPDGLLKIGGQVEQLKGRKTFENVSCG